MRTVRRGCDEEKFKAVDVKNHRLCGASFIGSGQTGLAGKGKENADRLDRQKPRRGGRFCGGRKGREHYRLYNAPGYAVRGDVYGACARTCACKGTCHGRDKGSGGRLYL